MHSRVDVVKHKAFRHFRALCQHTGHVGTNNRRLQNYVLTQPKINIIIRTLYITCSLSKQQTGFEQSTGPAVFAILL